MNDIRVHVEMGRHFYRLSRSQVTMILTEVLAAVSSWRIVAAGFGITPSETRRMSHVFDNHRHASARELATR
jgi:hypothetical protein